MSRGLGRVQREILAAVERAADGVGVLISDPDMTPAERSAWRRAANQLDAAGLIVLVSQRVAPDGRGQGLLVAYPPGPDAPLVQWTQKSTGVRFRTVPGWWNDESSTPGRADPPLEDDEGNAP